MATFQIPDPLIIISVRSGLPCDFHSDIIFLFIQTDLKFNATTNISSVFLFSMMTKHNVQCTDKVLSFALQRLLKLSAINSITFAQNNKIQSAFLYIDCFLRSFSKNIITSLKNQVVLWDVMSIYIHPIVVMRSDSKKVGVAIITWSPRCKHPV